MKIVVAKNMVPFVHGGAETLAGELCHALREHGHTVALVEIPFWWSQPHHILENVIANRLLRFDDVDHFIALKFPAYTIDHPNKIVWLLHQFRQAYDLWDTPYSNLPTNETGKAVRDAVHELDSTYLPTARKLFTISRTVSNRLKHFSNLNSEVLYPPLANHNAYYTEDAEDYFYYPSRYTEAKRQHLVIEALALTKSPVRLILTGNVDDQSYVEKLQHLTESNNLSNRVRMEAGMVTEQEKRALLAKSIGCIYTPFNEDYGYITLEAMYSHKPVLTVQDSGEPHAFIQHEKTGLSVETSPQALADAMDALYNDKRRAQSYGDAAFDYIQSLAIGWEHTIPRLLE